MRMQLLRDGEGPSARERLERGRERGRDSDNTMNTRSMLHITIRHEENKRVTAQYEQKGNMPGQNMTRERDTWVRF